MIRNAKVAIEAAVPASRMMARPKSAATAAGSRTAPAMATGNGHWFSCRKAGRPCSMMPLKLGSAVAQAAA